MRRLYRGHDILVEREGTILSDDALHYAIFRLDDGKEVASGPYYGAETVREFLGHMKERVDNEIESGGSHEPDPFAYKLDRCERLPEHLQRQLPDEVRVRSDNLA